VEHGGIYGSTRSYTYQEEEVDISGERNSRKVRGEQRQKKGKNSRLMCEKEESLFGKRKEFRKKLDAMKNREAKISQLLS